MLIMQNYIDMLIMQNLYIYIIFLNNFVILIYKNNFCMYLVNLCDFVDQELRKILNFIVYLLTMSFITHRALIIYIY